MIVRLAALLVAIPPVVVAFLVSLVALATGYLFAGAPRAWREHFEEGQRVTERAGQRALAQRSAK